MPGAVDAKSFLQMINRRISIRQASELADEMIGSPIAAYDMGARRVVMAPITAIEQTDISDEVSYRMLIEDGTVIHLSGSTMVLVRRSAGAKWLPARKLRRDDTIVVDSTMGWTRDVRVLEMMRWQTFFGFQVAVEGGLPITANRVVVAFS